MKFFYIFFPTLLLTDPAYAYMDLGSAGALVQIILSGIAGALIGLKLYFNKIKKFFTKDKNKKT